MTMKSLKFVSPEFKMRQRNTAESLFLDRRLADMETLYHKQDKRYRTDISNLHYTLGEFSRDGGDRVLQYFDFKISNGADDRRLKTARKRSDDPVKRKKVRQFVPYADTPRQTTETPKDDSICSKIIDYCVLSAAPTNKRCPHFPCTIPKGYNSIGFQLKTRQYPKSAGCARDVQSNPNYIASTSSEMETVNSSTAYGQVSVKQSKLSIRDKVSTLRQVLEERKRKMETLRPEPWEINYGRPVPLRRIQNPVRPVTTGDLVLGKNLRS